MFGKKPKATSVWNRELIPDDSRWRRDVIPEDSFLRKELLPPDSIWDRDLLASRKSRCLQCPILMLAEAHRCNKYNRIPDDVWNGITDCPLYG